MLQKGQCDGEELEWGVEAGFVGLTVVELDSLCELNYCWGEVRASVAPEKW